MSLDNTIRNLNLFYLRTKNNYWLKEIIKNLRLNNQFKNNLEHIISAKSEIYQLKIPEIKELFIIKEGKEQYNREIEINKQLKKIVPKGVYLPEPITTFKKNDKYYYIMKKEQGKTATQIIREKGTLNKEINNKITETITKIHLKMETKNLNHYNYIKELKRKKYDDKFIKDIKPMIEILKNSKNIGFFNDSTSDNWLINKQNKIILLDTEDWGKISFGGELAFFLNCIPIGNEKKINSTFYECLKKIEPYYNDKKLNEEIRYEFYLANLHMSLIKIPSMNKRNRQKDEEVIKKVGLMSIQKLRKEFPNRKNLFSIYNTIENRLKKI